MKTILEYYCDYDIEDNYHNSGSMEIPFDIGKTIMKGNALCTEYGLVWLQEKIYDLKAGTLTLIAHSLRP